MSAALALAVLAGTPGRVVLAGDGVAFDAATCDDLGARERVLLLVGDAGPAKVAFAAAGAATRSFALDPERPFPGDDREAAEVVRAARCVVLSGGRYLDWYRLVTPGGATTRLAAAVRAAHEGGATIVGLGAAAPFLAEWTMVERAATGKPVRNPRRPHEDVAVRGLGLLPGLLADSSAAERGSPARLLRATFDGGLDRALFVGGGTAWIADPARETARVVGAGRTLLFDVTRARRSRGTWRDARVAALAEGARWSRREGVACAGDPGTLEDLRNALEAAGATLTLHQPPPGPVGAVCETAFDLAWEPAGS